ncbi:MAG: hypothetical protein ABIT08_14780 [Bacteroidia bacterium]
MENKMHKVQPLYRCSQDKIVEIMKRGWRIYLSDQEKFAAYSDVYTIEYGNLICNELKDFGRKGYSCPLGSQESERINLVKLSKNCLFNYRLLQSHIKKSYPLFLRKSKIRDAGSSLYRKASRKHWASLYDLLKKGEDFLKENHKVLSENGMPVHFPETYFKIVKDFHELHIKYNAIMQFNNEEATNRIKQLNKLYIQTIDMFSDAQLIMKGKVFRSLSLTRSMNYYKRKNKKKAKQLELGLQIKPIRKSKKKENINKQKAA